MTVMNELQAKYLQGVETLSEDELHAFKRYNVDNIDAPFREDRISALDRRITAIKKTEDYQDTWEREWRMAAHEYVALTDSWIVKGATHRLWIDTYTIWELGGKEFFRWEKGGKIVDIIVDARKGDERLAELLSGGGGV